MLKYLLLIFLLIGCSNIEKNKTTNNYKLLKALNLYSKGEKSKALYVYQEILKENPENIIALREAGIINAQLGNLDESERYLNKAYQEDEKDEVVLKNLGLLYFTKENYSKSLKILNKIPNDLKDSKDYTLIGYNLYKEKKYEEAVKNYSKVSGKEIIENKIFFLSYIESLKNIKNSEEISKYMINIENNIGNNKENTIILATFYDENLKNYKKSEQILKQYLSKNALDDDILYRLYKLYAKIGEKEKSKRVFELISNQKKFNMKI